MKYHRHLTPERWSKFELVEQLANVGSEVERAIMADRAGRLESRGLAIERALELFELTAADKRWRGARLREVLRAREEFLRLFYGKPDEPADAEAIRRYFLAFAFACRR